MFHDLYTNVLKFYSGDVLKFFIQQCMLFLLIKHENTCYLELHLVKVEPSLEIRATISRPSPSRCLIYLECIRCIHFTSYAFNVFTFVCACLYESTKYIVKLNKYFVLNLFVLVPLYL